MIRAPSYIAFYEQKRFFRNDEERMAGRRKHTPWCGLTIPLRKEWGLLQIFKQLFSNHVSPPASSALFSNGFRDTAAEATQVRAC